jgi:hypothetical protein
MMTLQEDVRGSVTQAHQQSNTGGGVLARIDIAKRAADELTAAVKALNKANALFGILENMAGSSDPAEGYLLAQIGTELTANYGERAAAEADFFAEMSHGN